MGRDHFGVGIEEARYWHRKAYGGQGRFEDLSSHQLGHAAAYEAYRTWIHNRFMYEPFEGDFERQRQGLIGLAAAEAPRLIQSFGPYTDRRFLEEATEAAAATASVLFLSSREEGDSDLDEYRNDFRSGSMYSHDNRAWGHFRRPRFDDFHEHRGSFDDGYPSSPFVGGGGSLIRGSMPMPIPGVPSYAASDTLSTSPYLGGAMSVGSFPHSPTFPSTVGSAITFDPFAVNGTMGIQSPYSSASQYGAYGSYYHRPRYSSISGYGPAAFAGTSAGYGGYAQPTIGYGYGHVYGQQPPQIIVVSKSRRKHRHRHHTRRRSH